MKLIVGLGNPGKRYEKTRHNLGFMIIDCLIEEIGSGNSQKEAGYWLGEGKIHNKEVLLLKPLMYMNRSGVVVKEITERLGVDNTDTLIIMDDINLPLGTVRIRRRGSDGGHNGLASIIYQLKTEEIPRLRLGIRNESDNEDEFTLQDSILSDFVLSEFERDEHEIVASMLVQGKKAILSILQEGIDKTMNLYN